jgi:hypothetical protein
LSNPSFSSSSSATVNSLQNLPSFSKSITTVCHSTIRSERLASGTRGAAADKVFSLEHVKRQLQLSEFQGRKVYRLSNEFQIVYISAHWCWGLTIVDGLIAMLDIIYLPEECERAAALGPHSSLAARLCGRSPSSAHTDVSSEIPTDRYRP